MRSIYHYKKTCSPNFTCHWFDAKHFETKTVFNKSRNTFNRERNDINRKAITHARTQFNNAKQRA